MAVRVTLPMVTEASELATVVVVHIHRDIASRVSGGEIVHVDDTVVLPLRSMSIEPVSPPVDS